MQRDDIHPTCPSKTHPSWKIDGKIQKEDTSKAPREVVSSINQLQVRQFQTSTGLSKIHKIECQFLIEHCILILSPRFHQVVYVLQNFLKDNILVFDHHPQGCHRSYQKDIICPLPGFSTQWTCLSLIQSIFFHN